MTVVVTKSIVAGLGVLSLAWPELVPTTYAISALALLWNIRTMERFYGWRRYLTAIAMGVLASHVAGGWYGMNHKINAISWVFGPLFLYHADAPPPTSDKLPAYVLGVHLMSHNPVAALAAWMSVGALMGGS